MKIAFVNDSFLKGRGVDTVIYELARRLGKKHDVTVICGTSDIPEENFKIKKLRFGKLATGSAVDFLGFNKLKKFRDASKGYDVINLHHSTLASAFLGMKNTFVTYHGSPKILESERNLLRVIFRFAANLFNVLMLRNNTRVIAISKYIERNLENKLVPKKKIIKINNGIDLSSFKPSSRDKGYMLFVGRHEKHKRIDEMIRLSKDIGFPLIITGSGRLTTWLKDYAKKIAARKVRFVGRVSRKKLIKLYQECSFFVSATRWEGFGLIFIEAAACGKPSIAYSKCSMPEVIKDKKTGFLVENYPEFRTRARILVKDRDARRRLGKNALFFSKKFSWDKAAKEYGKLFKS